MYKICAQQEPVASHVDGAVCIHEHNPYSLIILPPLPLQSFMDLGLLYDPPPDIPITFFLPPRLYFQ
jgi:hypothetical protein